MDRSLWLLIRLRVRALFRRWKKTLSKPKGIAVGVVMAFMIAYMIFSMVIISRIGMKPPLEQIRRFGPLGMFVFTVGSLLFAAGEQALYYSPAEITFLFAGPYRKRQLLGYKVVVTIGLCLFSALFFSMASTMMSPRMVSAFFGSFLLLLFLQVLQMVVGLAASTLGALAWSRGRRLILAGLVVLLVLSALTAGLQMGGLGGLETLEKIERSPVAQVALAPFRWFILAFTADRIWPDLVKWGWLGMVVDAALIVLAFALDASYLEASASASAKRFAKIKRLGGGGGGLRSTATRKTGRFRFKPPSVPWWGGVGPNLWRQMTSALGDPGRMFSVLVLISIAPIAFLFIMPRNGPQGEPLPYVCMGLIAWMSIVLSGLLPYDFRGDIDLMEELKVLPIRPSRLALGQLLTPSLIATLAQAIAMATVILGLGGNKMVLWAVLGFLLPVNFLFYSIENLLFLWFPSRIVAGQFDIMAVGRQVLFLLAKVLGLAIGSGMAALVGFLVYLGTRQNLAAVVASWLALSGFAVALLPLIGQAFTKFDVASDVPA